MGGKLATPSCEHPDVFSPPSPLNQAALVSELCYAASQGDADVVVRCLDKDLDVNATDYDRRTALHIAASDGQINVVELLINRRAEVNKKDRWGHTALREAERGGYGDIKAFLTESGAEASPQDLKEAATSEAHGNGYVMHCSEEAPKPKTEIENAMLLCCAAAAGSAHIVQELVQRRADLNSADYDGRTALHVASSHGHTKVVEWLLTARADVSRHDSFGLTPLSEAMRSRQDAVAKILVSMGAEDSDNVELTDVRLSADAGAWAIPATEVEIGPILSTTLKSVIYRATWRGTQVVAKTSSVLITGMSAAMEPAKASAGSSAGSEKASAAQEVVHEIRLLSTLRHPDLVMFLGACFDHSTPFFITEFMEGGDLERYYMAQKAKTGYPFRPSWATLMRWSSAVARALCFLHGCHRPIIHRDLKPLNLLLTRSEDVKVTDFGISKLMAPRALAWMDESGASKDSRPAPYMSGGVGTWRYMAPEVVRYEQYTDRVDIYSFALIMWFMGTGQQPFVEQFGQDAEKVLREYLRGGEPRPDGAALGSRFGGDAQGLRQLVQDCWHEVPTSRPSAHECTQRLAGMAACDDSTLASLKKPFASMFARQYSPQRRASSA